MYQIASYYCDGSIRKPYCHLRKVFQNCKGRDLRSSALVETILSASIAHWKLLPAIVYAQRGQALRSTGLLVRLIQSPDLQYRLIGEVLRNGNEERCSSNLLDLRDIASMVCFEGTDNLEGL